MNTINNAKTESTFRVAMCNADALCTECNSPEYVKVHLTFEGLHELNIDCITFTFLWFPIDLCSALLSIIHDGLEEERTECGRSELLYGQVTNYRGERQKSNNIVLTGTSHGTRTVACLCECALGAETPFF